MRRAGTRRKPETPKALYRCPKCGVEIRAWASSPLSHPCPSNGGRETDLRQVKETSK